MIFSRSQAKAEGTPGCAHGILRQVVIPGTCSGERYGSGGRCHIEIADDHYAQRVGPYAEVFDIAAEGIVGGARGEGRVTGAKAQERGGYVVQLSTCRDLEIIPADRFGYETAGTRRIDCAVRTPVDGIVE